MDTEYKTIEEKRLLGELPPDIRGTPEWELLRSEIYLRDKGICWVCNSFVLLREYDLGHLVDYCMGGLATWQNLAVMHGYCNDIKPDHSTLEEAMKWRLTPRSIIHPQPLATSKTIKDETMFLNQLSNIINTPAPEHKLSWIDKEYEIVRFFKANPHLLIETNTTERSIASQRLALQYKLTTGDIRKMILAAGLMKKREPILPNDNLYFDMYNHLKEYVDKFNSLNCAYWDKAKAMGITSYSMRIMLYLSGHPELIDKADIVSIANRAKALSIPTQQLFINHKNAVNPVTTIPSDSGVQVDFGIANAT